MNEKQIAKELIAIAKSLTADITWWKAIFGFGRIFFEAGSASHAHAKAKKWGQKSGMGRPDKVVKTEEPRALHQRGAFTYDRTLDVYVEQ
jgi:hypothetical protein